MWALRTTMLLSLIVWLGGIIFFAFVLARTLFVVLPPQMAGDVVRPALTNLHWMGLISGAVFLFASVLYNCRKFLQLRLLSGAHIFIALMMVLTAISQFGITPRMRELRAEMARPDAWHDSDQIEFSGLHRLSTGLEGTVLLFGTVVVILTARRFGETSH